MTAIRSVSPSPPAIGSGPKTDLLVGFGTRLDVPLGRWGKPPPDLKVARIDIDPAEMRRLKVDLGIVADSATTARLLTAAAPQPGPC